MRVRPFHGYRYAIGERDLSKVVAPPYDQIDAETQERLHGMSPWNVVRLSLPKAAPGADGYAAARATLEAWLRAGVFARDDGLAMYPYHQTYAVSGETVTRRGVVALGEASDYSRGIVQPHERTHQAPKEDRLRLLEATGADLGVLFMLVNDPAAVLGRVTAPAGEPIAEARDLRGELHRLWRVTDEATIREVQAFMATRRPIIADGHHRYETAVAYARRLPAARDKLMGFFALEAPGLTIFPNHRLVHGVGGFAFERFLAAARRWFDVTPLADPFGFAPANRRIGVVAGAHARVLTLRDDAFDGLPWPAGTSRAWRELAVSILHVGLLRPLLDITDEKLEAKTHVDYTADQAEAVALARSGRYQAAFLIAPTTPGELEAVVQGGELLPQKSTHFYPKLLDGLVFHRLGEPDGRTPDADRLRVALDTVNARHASTFRRLAEGADTSTQSRVEGRHRVSGVDFSGAMDAGRRIWVASGHVEDGSLRIEECRQAMRLVEGARARDRAFRALRDLIASRRDSVIGLDFPFGLPSVCCEVSDWEGFIRSFGTTYRDAEDFRQKKCWSHAGNRELRRATDHESHTPFSAYNLRLYRQTYYGLRDVLNPLVRDEVACVLPMQTPQPGRVWLIEICPASTLKRISDKPVPPYKGSTERHRDARKMILSELQRNRELKVVMADPKTIVEDPGGDAIDAVIAAFSTARALAAGFAVPAAAQALCALEGYVYS